MVDVVANVLVGHRPNPSQNQKMTLKIKNKKWYAFLFIQMSPWM